MSSEFLITAIPLYYHGSTTTFSYPAGYTSAATISIADNTIVNILTAPYIIPLNTGTTTITFSEIGDSTVVYVTVNKATPVLTWATVSNITYGTLLSTTQLNATTGNLVLDEYITYNHSIGTILTSGVDQSLIATLIISPLDNNYVEGTYTKTVNITVNQRAVSLTGSKTYNKNTTLVGSALTITNKISGDTVTISGTGISSLSSADAGSITISSYTNYSLDNSNYTLTGASSLITVNSISVSLTGSKIYNKNTTLMGSALTITNKLSGDIVTISGTGTSSLALADVGSTTISSYTNYSLDNSNYTLSSASSVITINPLPVTLTGSKIYNKDTTLVGSALTITNIISGDTVAISGTGASSLTASTVGSTTISSYTNYSLNNSNYSLIGASSVITINQLPVTLTGSKIYNKNTDIAGNLLTITNIISGDTLLISGTGISSLATMHVGITTISNYTNYSISNANYTLTGASSTITISALPVSLTGSKIYNKNKTLEGNLLTVTNKGLDSVTVSGTGVDSLASLTSGTTSISDYTNYSLDNSDYTFVGASSVITINKLPVSLTGSKTYDGNRTFTGGPSLIVSNIQADDVVTISGTGSASSLASANAGTTSISSYTNYTVSNTNYTLTGASSVITVNPLVVSLTGTKIYNGTKIFLGSALVVSNKVSADTVLSTAIGGTGNTLISNVGSTSITDYSNYTMANTNYTLAGASSSISITRLPINLSGTKTYDGNKTISSDVLTITNKVSGDSVTITGTGVNSMASPNGPTTTINNFTNYSIDNSNYIISGGSSVITITPIVAPTFVWDSYLPELPYNTALSTVQLGAILRDPLSSTTANLGNIDYYINYNLGSKAKIGHFTYSTNTTTIDIPLLDVATYTITAELTITNPNYISGIQLQVNKLIVQPILPTIFYYNPPPIASGSLISSAQLNASTNLPGGVIQYSYSTDPILTKTSIIAYLTPLNNNSNKNYINKTVNNVVTLDVILNLT